MTEEFQRAMTAGDDPVAVMDADLKAALEDAQKRMQICTKYHSYSLQHGGCSREDCRDSRAMLAEHARAEANAKDAERHKDRAETWRSRANHVARIPTRKDKGDYWAEIDFALAARAKEQG